MRAIKFFSAAIAMAFAMNASAKTFDDGNFTVNENFGSIASVGGFGLGVGYQTEVYSNQWLTLNWDVLHFEWDAPFNSPGDWNQLDFKTGVRAFSPSFAGDHLRAYTNLDLGYVLGLAKGPFVSSAFGLTWGAGIQYNEKWSLGYTLQYETAGKSKNHFATITYIF